MNNKWYGFMASNEWVIFINIVRLLTFVGIFMLVVIMAVNIEEVKILGTDACAYCMNKTGAKCYIGDSLTEVGTLLPNVNLSEFIYVKENETNVG